MTPQERQAIAALSRCTFLPGSWDKRFTRFLAGMADDAELTERQREWLGKLTHKYRRQISEQERLETLYDTGTAEDLWEEAAVQLGVSRETWRAHREGRDA